MKTKVEPEITVPTEKEWKQIISIFRGDEGRNNYYIRQYLEEIRLHGSVEYTRAYSIQEETNSLLSMNRIPFFMESFSPKGIRLYHLRVVKKY